MGSEKKIEGSWSISPKWKIPQRDKNAMTFLRYLVIINQSVSQSTFINLNMRREIYVACDYEKNKKKYVRGYLVFTTLR